MTLSTSLALRCEALLSEADHENGLGWVGLGWVGLSLAGCEPIQYVDAVGETGAPRFLLPLEGEGGGGFSTVGSVTGSIGELRYVADSEKRIYLLRGDLDEGIDPLGASVATLRFPESPNTSVERRVAVGEDQSWDSLRTYDMGACSLFLPWGLLQSLLNTRIVTALRETQGGRGAGRHRADRPRLARQRRPDPARRWDSLPR